MWWVPCELGLVMVMTSIQCIAEGDLVIVYERHDRMKAVTVQKGSVLQNKYGIFAHEEWLGKPFGSRVCGKQDIGFVYLLAPTAELWTLVLSHRTQILYVADISFVIMGLELKPGSIVLECGTGSGSLTTSLARAVAPTGHVHTFDFHEQRASSAREDFERNQISNIVDVAVRDIQGEGFPLTFLSKADGIFLDLPQPWLAIDSVAKCLQPNSSCCSFSPCIEQVQRTCESFRIHNFRDIRTFEVLLRSYDVRFHSELTVDNNIPPQKRKRGGEEETDSINLGKILAKPYPETKGHTGFLTFARLIV